MNRLFVTLLLTAMPAVSFVQESTPKTALILIDIQEFYFPGGRAELVQPEKAAANAARLLELFRSQNRPIVHVRHDSESGGQIHPLVKPEADEKIITKHQVNSFHETDLLHHLTGIEVKRLVICGMQTHMCVEAAVRAAHDLGFDVILIHDACATRALTFDQTTVPAEDVHASTLATLSRTYAKVMETEACLQEYEIHRLR